MRRDHRPYIVKRWCLRSEQWYARHFLRPQFDRLGSGAVFLGPRHVEIFGGPVRLGDHAHVIATPDKKVRLTVWSTLEKGGAIDIGDYCLICPGVRISAATHVEIGDSAMIAQGVLISDADWHGVYDRSHPIGQTAPVRIGANVWLGDSVIVGKGVAIGDNTVVGAGSVVIRDLPAGVIAAGNPAAVVRTLDPAQPLRTRADWLRRPEDLAAQFDVLDRHFLRNNTWSGWIRSLLFPRPGD